MSYSIIPTDDFKRFFKKLFKKYPSLKEDLKELTDGLADDYELGTSLGGNIYKIRFAISSKNKGKSGGARLIYLFVTDNNEIYLIHIYDKSDTDSISKKTIIQLLKNAGLS